MAKWITLITFNQAANAHLIKTKLESEGIAVFIKNEHMAQLSPYHSEPGGPVKLQVDQRDAKKAAELLKQTGYLKEEKAGFRKSALIKGIDLFTSRLPGLRNMPLQLRVTLAAAILLVAITLIVTLLTLPSSV